MLGLFQDLIQAAVLIGALVSGGALLSPRFRKNWIVLAICIVWSTLSFLYLFRPFFGESEDAFQVFDKSACLKNAEATVGVMSLETSQGVMEVRDFLSNFELMNAGTEFESYALYTDDFQIFYDANEDRFSVLLNLNTQAQTPGSAAQAAAQYLQENLCLEKQQICGINYTMGAPRATNMQYPDLQGRVLSFNYCNAG